MFNITFHKLLGVDSEAVDFPYELLNEEVKAFIRSKVNDPLSEVGPLTSHLKVYDNGFYFFIYLKDRIIKDVWHRIDVQLQ